MPRLISFDLGSHAVKATLFQLSGRNQLELVKRYEHVVPQDGVAPGLEQRLAALDALLDDTPTLKPSSADVALLAWPSLVTHPHEAGPLTSGVKYGLTIWCELPNFS